MQPDAPAVNILWTGGWDSTFRVLQLVREGRRIQPHYLLDDDRPSSQMELDTVRRITEILQQDHGADILPLQVEAVRSLAVDDGMDQAFRDSLRTRFIGKQYTWLAAYCRHVGVQDMELSIHQDDKACDLILPHIERLPDGVAALRPDCPAPVRQLFGDFRFPILDVTKMDMQRQTAAWGLEEIMNLTWFCHRPLFGRYPCGVCNPCIYTIQEGLGSRLPWFSHLRYHMRIYPRLKQLITRHPALYHFLYKRFR